MEEHDYREQSWYRRGDADVDLDERVCEGGDFEEWVEQLEGRRSRQATGDDRA